MPRSFVSLALLLTACMGSDATTAEATQQVQPAPLPVREMTVLSDPYHIDAMYRSMRGPWGQQHVYLWESPQPELLWITGYETHVVDAESQEDVGQQFMCHANLDFDVQQYYDDFNLTHGLSGRVFTLSQGQQHIQFPEGFGIPILSTQPLKLWLSHSLPSELFSLRSATTSRGILRYSLVVARMTSPPLTVL